MTLHITDIEFKLLRDLIEKRCGILLGDNKAYLVENRLSPLVKEAGCKSFGEFYFKLKSLPSNGNQIDRVVDAITTNETFWFRDGHSFQALKDKVFPELYRQIDQGVREKIKICSAGCSTGQEPYSIAMTAQDFFLDRGGPGACFQRVEIVALDVSRKSLDTAASGCYDVHSLSRGMPDKLAGRYFSERDGRWTIKPEIKKLVSFHRFNLRYSMSGFGKFDIFFLRNVIIYFSDSFKKSILEETSRILSPGGYLFLGAGETTGVCAPCYETKTHQGAMFHKRNSKKCC